MNAATETEFDTFEPEERNEFGRPVPNVHAVRNHGNTTQNVDNSNGKNNALPWIAFSWFLSGGAVIGLVLMAIMQPRMLESAVSEAVALARADTVAQLAKAQVDMQSALSDVKMQAMNARQEAKIAMTEVQDATAELRAKKLIAATH